MRTYPDASILIAATLSEPNSEQSLALLTGATDLVGSEWLVTEIASALGIKQRLGLIGERTRIEGLQACRGLLLASATMLAISADSCRHATDLIERSSLRGGDALHLAIAAANDAIVWTLDRRMADAGQGLGLGTRLLTA